MLGWPKKVLTWKCEKKFQGMHFRDLYELATKVTKYLELLKEDNLRKKQAMGTYFKDMHHTGVEVATVAVATAGSIIYPKLVRPSINGLQ